MSRVTLSRRACRGILLSSPSASGSAALCSDVAALRGSLQELTSIRPSASTVTELRSAVQNVQTNLAALSSAAGAVWNGQVQNLRSALTKLQSAVSTLAAQRNASSVSGVVTALGGVSAAARQLLDAASPSCPSPSASSGSSAS
jgi:ABC-type transporter Mla subunit MlaD